MRKKKKETHAPSTTAERMGLDALFVSAQEVRAAELEFLLPGRLVQGAFTLLEGDPSSGKSVFLSHLAASVTSGKPFLERPKQKPGGVLWLTAEEDPGAHIRPRLEMAKADCSRVKFCTPGSDGMARGMQFPTNLSTLTEAISHYGLKLVIMDPLVSHLAIPDGLNQEGPVRVVLDALQRLAVGTGCTLLGVRQLKKDRTGGRITWGLGSVAIPSVARSVLQIDRPNFATERRILRTIKCLGGGRTPPYEYTLDFSKVVPVMTGGRDLLPEEDDGDTADFDSGERDVREDARMLLKAAMYTDKKKKAKAANDIINEAARAGIGERTLRKAKADLQITSKRISDVNPPSWEWAAPEDWPEDEPAPKAG